MIDLIYTVENLTKVNARSSALSILIEVNIKNKEHLRTKILFSNLYKDMHASYMKTAEELAQFSDCFEEEEETYIDSEERYHCQREEKIRFKYTKTKKRPEESKDWWKEYDIQASERE